MSEEEFSTILQQQEVTSPHLETKVLIYLQWIPIFQYLRNPEIRVIPLPNLLFGLTLKQNVTFFLTKTYSWWFPPLISSQTTSSLRCGKRVAASTPSDKINSCRICHQQYFPRCRQRKKFYDYRNLYHFKNAQKCDLYIRTWPEWPGSSMDMGKYHMNYKVFERVLQDFLHQQSTVAEKRSDKHTGKVPVKHTFTIKHSNSLLRTCLS